MFILAPSSCTWDGRPCGGADFETIFTDYGVCYTFNSGTDDKVRYASHTGQYMHHTGQNRHVFNKAFDSKVNPHIHWLHNVYIYWWYTLNKLICIIIEAVEAGGPTLSNKGQNKDKNVGTRLQQCG